ncbi:MAG: dihydropteroate synthase [Phycisphaerae bacterium]|jgi:5-methyltetrahydrofolate--homocysteine methyltransferase|nr:dihydropteroate synthase [Phycisphaerae bacterium]
MIVVAERINATRKQIARAIEERDEELIKDQARKQDEAGATYIDINAAISPAKELDAMKWAVGMVREAVPEVPLAIDSASVEVMRAGLELAGGGDVFLNSITGEKERLEGLLPLAAEFGTKVVALAMDDRGLPETVDGRFEALEVIFEATDAAGIERERVFVDPLVRPISTNPAEAANCLEVIRRIKAECGGAKTICGLSNVSFGLPQRNLLNRAFLALCLGAGLDAALIDPLAPGVMATVLAAEALFGRDEYCMTYIQAERAGKLEQ